MPNKWDKVAINNPELDNRVRLTDDLKEAIKADYASGTISIRGLERKYKVSRRSIQFLLFPERQEKAKMQFAERQKDGRYYDKDKHREYMKKHRAHKKDLVEKGLLKSDQ